MNAWFKEERKPTEEETSVKLTSQESGNEYAKKRWLRQAISEEGDSGVVRPGKYYSVKFVFAAFLSLISGKLSGMNVAKILRKLLGNIR